MKISMQRIDPASNMARFYRMELQPDLFGGVRLVRNWGRIGAKGQMLTQYFDDEPSARQKLSKLEQVKRRKGYL